MRYFDGELNEAEAAEVRSQLELDADAQARHGGLLALRTGIEVAAEEVSREVDFDALYARIEAGLPEPSTERKGAEQTAPGLMSWLSGAFKSLLEHPGQLWAPAAGLAAAAALLMVVGRQAPDAERAADPAAQKVAVPTKPPKVAEPGIEPEPRKREMALAAAGSEIVQVDFGDNTGTVFEIALAEGVSTPVVWINDDFEE